MFGKRRLTILTYFLAVFIFLLTLSGDGAALLQGLDRMRSGNKASAELDIASARTEKLLMEGTPWETTLYIIGSPVEGPTVMVIGGIHGDEPAGYLAAESIVSWAVDRGTLLVLPRANMPAVAEQKRSVSGSADLNRSFPGSDRSDDQTARLAAAIFGVMQEYEPDWVVDLHEADHCEYKSPGALGQTFIYPYESSGLDIVKELLIAVNRTIYLEEYNFMLLRGAAHGTAIETAQLSGSEAIIIETCKQMDLSERVKYQRQVVSSLLYLLGVAVF